ncbi:MAG TPA: DivIVA domain-containing protein [Gaiellales bacterium]|jgi:cell division initiation protein|nr:DivIVA domain-containing protein [Gaiellales bacterium]
MTLSPVELRHERPKRRPFGYRRADVDHLLESATGAYEVVWRERAELDDRVHELETQLAQHRETEAAMRSALVTAERAADEQRATAARQAELIVREAEAKARDIVHAAYAERERVRRQTSRMLAEEAEFRLRLRALLGATLEAVRDHEQRLTEAVDRPARAGEQTMLMPPADPEDFTGGD